MKNSNSKNEFQSSNLIVHIGFGKTSTSKLQAEIFPLLCKDQGYNYWGNEPGPNFKFTDQKKLTLYFTHLISRMWLDKPIKRIKLQDNTFISNEGLSSYRDAYRMLDYAEKNLKAFGKDAHIILTIREPRKWLTSIYMQRCVHENPIQDPKDFFLNDENYSPYLPDAKFNIDKFDYIKIIDKYRELFDKVTIVKFEALTDMKFLTDVFLVSEKKLVELTNLYKIRRVNAALSITSIRIIKYATKILAQFNLSFKAKYSNAVLLSRSNVNLLNTDTLRNSEIRGLKSIRVKIFSKFHYKVLLQNFVDKIVPYKKYNLDFDKLNYINIESLEQQYASLPDFITYKKSNKSTK